MSRFHLDTSAYAAFLRDHAEAVLLVREASELFVCPIVLGELRAGFRKGTRLAENERLLQQFLDSPRCRVPPIDDDTSHRYGVIHDHLRRHGTPVSPNDLWIAASAAQHGTIVVTVDGDFDRIPQVLVQRLTPPRKR